MTVTAAPRDPAADVVPPGPASRLDLPVVDITRPPWPGRLERWRKVAVYRRTRGQIEDAAYRYARSLGEEVEAISSRSPAWGRFLYWSGQASGWAGAALAAWGLWFVGRPDLDNLVFGPFGIGVILLLVAGPLTARGRRLLAPTAAELVALDTRRPVLLLASFRATDAEIITGADETGGAGTDRRLETIVGQPFRRFGPFIALRPAAARQGFGEADWDAVTGREMDRAALLVAMPAASEALPAEIGAVANRRHAHKLLVLMPPLDGNWPWQPAPRARARQRRQNEVEAALAWRPKSGASGVWDRTKRRLRSTAETEEELRIRRWETMRAALASVPGFQALPAVPPARLLAVHLSNGTPVLVTGPKVPSGPDYQRAIAYAVYGMKCHGRS